LVSGEVTGRPLGDESQLADGLFRTIAVFVGARHDFQYDIDVLEAVETVGTGAGNG